MTKFFITVRSVSQNQFGNNLGPIRYLAVPEDETPAPSHAIGVKAWLTQVMATFAHDLSGVITGNVLFFVHGFNVGIADVDAEQNNVKAGLAGKFSCTLISFDWPSWTDTFAYLPELDIAKKTARPRQRRGKAIARGNDFVDGNKDTESMLGHAYRVTNYFNLYDAVLQISNVKRAGVEPRVGQVGLPDNAPPKTVSVDCSAHFATIRRPGDDPIAAASWSHSWYFSDANFYADLVESRWGCFRPAAVIR